MQVWKQYLKHLYLLPVQIYVRPKKDNQNTTHTHTHTHTHRTNTCAHSYRQQTHGNQAAALTGLPTVVFYINAV